MPDYGRGKRPIWDAARREDELRRDRDAVRQALDKLTDYTIRTIAERGERVARGSVEGERVGSGKGTVADPAARVALEGLPNDEETPDQWRERADAVGRCIAEIGALLESASAKVDYVLSVKVDEVLIGSHKTAGICRACQRNVTGSADDRLREGYCNACRLAWKRRQKAWTDAAKPGAPDRRTFERERAAKAEQERHRAS